MKKFMALFIILLLNKSYSYGKTPQKTIMIVLDEYTAYTG